MCSKHVSGSQQGGLLALQVRRVLSPQTSEGAQTLKAALLNDDGAFKVDSLSEVSGNVVTTLRRAFSQA